MWNQQWLMDGGDIRKPNNLPECLDKLTVADLFISHSRFWNVWLIRSLVNNEDSDFILNTPIFLSCPA